MLLRIWGSPIWHSREKSVYVWVEANKMLGVRQCQFVLEEKPRPR